MADLFLFISSLLKLSYSPAALVIWRKKTDARIFPFIAGFLLIMGISFVRAFLRMLLASDDGVTNFVMQAGLTAVLEESGRYAAFRYILKDYERREDAVTYGIGHGLMENIGAAFATLNLIGNVDASSALLTFEGALGQLCGTVFHIASSVFVFFGVKKDKVKLVLPAAIALHFITNIFISGEPLIELAAAIFLGFGAYKLYESLEEQW